MDVSLICDASVNVYQLPIIPKKDVYYNGKLWEAMW